MPALTRGRRGAAQVEEDESPALRGAAPITRLRFHRGVDRPHLVGDGVRVSLFVGARQLGVRDLQLLDRLGLPVRLDQLIGEHDPHVVLIGNEVGELLQRAEGLVEVASLLHPARILEEVLACVALEPLLGGDLPELVVHDRAARRLAQDLVAERDGGVVEPSLGVVIDGALPDRHRLGQVAGLLQQVADAVVERDVDRVLLTALVDLDHLAIRRECLVHLLLGLEVGRFLLELEDIGHSGNLPAEPSA